MAAIALPQPLYTGRERATKALGIGRSRKGREGNDIKGYGEMGRRGRAWGFRVLVTPLVVRRRAVHRQPWAWL